MNNIVVRKITEEDVKYISDYLKDYYFNCGAIDDFWSNSELNAWVKNETDMCIGTYRENLMVGFCLTHYHKEAKKVHLENIFVIEGYRRQGIAKKMLTYITSYYIGLDNGIRYVGLVNTENKSAMDLLINNGFSCGNKMFWIQRNEKSL